MDCPEYTVRILSRIIMRVRRGDLPPVLCPHLANVEYVLNKTYVLLSL